MKSLFEAKNLSLAIVISSLIWSLAFFYSKVIVTRSDISVSGVAYKDVKADQARWTFTVANKQADRRLSYDSLISDERRIKDHLAQEGLDLSNFSCGEYSTRPVYEIVNEVKTQKVSGYQSEVRCVLNATDVYKVAEVYNSMNSYLVGNDLVLVENEVEYVYTKLNDIKIELLKKAADDAKERAKALSTNTGARIGKVTSASQGVFQVNPKGDDSVSGLGNLDTSRIDKTVKATVSVSFEVK